MASRSLCAAVRLKLGFQKIDLGFSYSCKNTERVSHQDCPFFSRFQKKHPGGTIATESCLQPHAGTGRAVTSFLLGAGNSDQLRCVARVKVHRFAGVVPLKVRSPKSEWYIQAEKEFLSEREKVTFL